MEQAKGRLYRIGYSFLKNEQDSLEAIQETTYRAYKNIKKLKEPNYFNTWVTRIHINYCISQQKVVQRAVPLCPEMFSTEEFNPTVKLDMDHALEKLKPQYKQVIVLKYFEDLSIEDIAKVMEAPEGTIKTWSRRALSCLKDILNKGGGYNA
ncbi:sigma-70 family RNA polymerase sigma factor [Alkalicella caledoniensis]|uniref:Sigma-70 family RNA polymerase sigma factor n=2 Tax=Alkalicella caledoniensis TaxID=2731377 RepID=A0A7G9WD43_ALKCA|nr:sigma-70 family RNA polymerase sigma factor [Alkalicella caledoniensis]